MATPSKSEPVLSHKGSLIICNEGTPREELLGFLIHSPDHGVFDSTHGKVDVTPEEAAIHNKLFSTALIEGLDERCQIGEGGLFYFHKGRSQAADPLKRVPHVVTFEGDVVAALGHPDCSEFRVGTQNVTFVRKGKSFRGRLKTTEESLFIKRIA